jgi:hypothetical protein
MSRKGLRDHRHGGSMGRETGVDVVVDGGMHVW